MRGRPHRATAWAGIAIVAIGMLALASQLEGTTAEVKRPRAAKAPAGDPR